VCRVQPSNVSVAPMVSKSIFLKGHLKSTGGASAQAGPNNEAERAQPYAWENTHTSEMQSVSSQLGLTTSGMNDTGALAAGADKLQTAVLNSSNAAISAKLADLTDAKEMLQQSLAETNAEYEALAAASDKTKAALDSKSDPIAATMQWLSIRLNRPKSEKLRDGSEIALDRLLATLRESVALLTDTYNAEQNELYRLSVAITALSADIADKEAALAIDGDTLATTKPAPATMALSPSLLGTVKPPFDPTQWRGSTKKIIGNANKIIEVSARLRGKAAEIEASALEKEKLAHAELVAENANSVAVLKSLIAKSEGAIADCSSEMTNLESSLAATTACREAKEESAAVVTSRLALRAQRPARERVYDGAQTSLQTELNAMTIATTDLKRSEERTKDDFMRVSSSKAATEYDLDQKKAFLDLELQCSSVAIM